MSSLPTPLPRSRSAPPGRPRDRPEPAHLREGLGHPLSHGQEALWYLDRLAPGSPAYVIAGAALFPAGLDEAAFRRAWEALVERHPALRTTYGEGPVQRIHPDLHGDWFQEIDATAWSEAETRDRLAAEAARPFDLERGPVLRVRLLRRGTGGDVFFLAVHHIAADLWSMGVLWNELGVLYPWAAQPDAGPPPLPLLPLQPADAALWQRRRTAGPDGDREWHFWRDHLAGAPLHLDLPADRPRPPVQSLRGATCSRLLDPAEAQGLEALAAATGGTLFTVLLAAWSTLLGRLGGQDDLVVGTPTPGRDAPELAGLVGYFVNPLPMRCDLRGDPPFRELVRRARATSLAAFRRRQLPFPLLAERLAEDRAADRAAEGSAPRDPSRSPVFQTLLSLQQAPRGGPAGLAGFAMELDGLPIALGDLPGRSVAFARNGAQLDASLLAAQVDGSLALSLELNGDLWDGDTAGRMLGWLRTLLAAAAADPDLALSRLPLLDEAERRQVLGEWNAAPLPLPSGPDVCLHQLFLARATLQPEAPALTAGGESLTYAQLAARVKRLARRLRAAGVGPEVRVGIALPRNADLVTALLATLAAGGAYVPLDPAYPEERRAFMLADSGARLLVSDCPAPAGADVAVLSPVVLHEPQEGAFEAPPVLPDNLAYVIYTSGSTGRPKGVAITHRSAVGLVRWARQVYSDEELAGTLAATSVCFDLSVYELFVPLAWGGRVILAENALALPVLPARDEVTLINTVPSAVAELVRSGGVPASVRTVNLAGEALQQSLVERIYASGTVGRLWNLYGPSEDTTYSTYVLTRPGDRAVAIGRPLPETRAYVLDPHGEPVPAGVPGELCLGGKKQARGYFARPDLTAERFVPDPFASEPGSRMYRTGDLVRWRAREPAELEFLGRIDHQVKVRGFRIELGEIEAALLSYPDLRDAAVLVRAAPASDLQLVAYVVGQGAPAPAGADLRARLKARLPEYMVPALFVDLPALPLSPNGKVDRRALARIAPGETEAPAGTSSPRTPTEEVLAGIWCDLLGRSAVGVDDDFFALGGHSLLATRMLGRARAALGVDLPLAVALRRPTVAGLAALAEATAAGPEAPVVPVPRGGELPLSFAQERLWFLDQMDPGSPLYNVPAGLRLRGPLSVPALAAALGEITRRHEALRTCLPAVGGRPVQRIAPPAGEVLPLVDLAALAPDVRAAELERLGTEEARRPFDLARGPLVRIHLVRLSGPSSGPEQDWNGDDHAALFTLHHTVCDGWSLGVLAAEVAALYPAALQGKASPLPALRVQYADHAVWQREVWAAEALPAQLDWWRARLAGAPQALELPADRPRRPQTPRHEPGARPAVRSRRGGVLAVALDEDLAAGIAALGRRSGATPFMVLLAAFSALLSRLSGQDDLLIGSAAANRGRPEVEPLIGFFANTVALRMDLRDEPGLDGLLGRARETVLAAYAHQELPFERLVAELAPERALDRTPLVQVVLVLQGGGPPAGWQRPVEGLALEPLAFHSGTAKFDLTLDLAPSPTDRRLAGTLEFSRDLFDEVTVRRTWQRFVDLLAAALESPETPLADLPLLSAAERREVLEEWNRTATPYPRESTLGELFAAQARATPGAVALAGGGREVTYGELDAWTDRLAGRLRALGVGPEVAVGLALERSVEAVAALLAVVKAGGAYVPLDLSHPDERLAFLLRDAGTAVLLTDSARAPRFPGVRHLLLDREEDEVPAAPGPPIDLRPENLAYVLYTSGSTGRPKGVAVTQRNVIRLVRGAAYAGFGPDEVYLQLAPLAFDASTLEIWAPLLNGGRLEVFPPHAPTIEELAAFVAERRVTSLWLTAGLFHQAAEQIAEPHAAGLRRLRWLLAGGDVLSPVHVERVRAVLAGTLVNGYGPTEGTTFTCCHPLPRSSGGSGASVPIGRPIANTRVYVLDRALRPLPPGVPGELLVGGDGLARGYHGRPDLTAERFVPDPVSGEAGARLYRTGDLARHRFQGRPDGSRLNMVPDGTLEFLGRLDHQVKIRGFRVEPGEVEAVLAEHPAVRAAAVAVRPDRDGGKLLAAWLVLEEGATVRGVREDLRRRLPEHLVPVAWVALPELPLNANGKVDRRALPEPDPAAAGEDGSRTLARNPPRNPIEELLAGIWAELLGLARVGIEDDFFDLGGHSLLATRLASRVRESCGVEVPLRTVFENPTIAGLAARIAEKRGETSLLPVSPLAPVPPALRAEGLPLSFAQERLWFLDQLDPGNPSTNIWTALSLRGALSVPALTRAVGAIVRRHEALRTTFAAPGGQPIQVVAPAARADFPIPRVDLRALPAPLRETELRRLARDEARTGFDLARGPLLRLRAVHLEGYLAGDKAAGDKAAGDEAAGEHALLACLHHIVADGWSIGVLVRELATLYPAGKRVKSPHALPVLPVQYGDFAAWQRGWLAGAALEREVAWWREALAGAPPVLDLPADRPRPPAQSFRGATWRFHLGPAVTAAVAALARRAGATPFMVLLAGFACLLGRRAGVDDVVVGSPVAGRTRREVEDLIGFFVNTLALRTRLDGDPDFRGVVERVRAACLAAYAHQEVPFARLVEELAPQRSLAHTPLFQVLFALQNAPLGSAGHLALPGLSVAPLPLPAATVQFDLAVALEESAGGGLAGLIDWSRDLFDAATVGRLAGHFAALLEAAAAAPDRPLSALPDLTEGERHQLLREWNDTAWDFPAVCLHHLIEEQVRRTPHLEAIAFQGRSLTYADLNRRANQVARALRRLGVGPETPVGVCAARSDEALVGLLAVLKAGGAYLPLDPAYPEERLAFALEDSGARVVLAQRWFGERFPGFGGAVLPLDQGWDRFAGEDGDDLPPLAGPDNLAYVIYTSGSTGRPKGVLVPHRGLVCLCLDLVEVWGLVPGDRHIAFNSLAFDASASNFYPVFLSGASFVVHPDPAELSGAELERFCREQDITHLDVPPAYWAGWLEELQGREDGDLLPTVRQLNLGGDSAALDRVRWWAALTGGRITIFGPYGPTEATVGSTCHLTRDGREVPRGTAKLPLGRPFAAVEVHVLDGNLQPVPVGVEGEIHIGGVGVTRGYLGRPDATAGVFLPDPFAAAPNARQIDRNSGLGARLYRTGDLARRLVDGTLEFLGRRDHQVKVRGFRIELGEVEAALRRHPAVREAVVLAREKGPGDRRLAAYAVAGDVSGTEIKAFLAGLLPAYMLPSAVTLLPALPVGPTGKVNRRALPEPDWAGDEDRPYEAPRRPAEEALARLWADLLGAARVGRGDDFFALGGHSLLATQAVSRVRAALGVELPVKALFEAPTLAAFAARVEAAQALQDTAGAPPLVLLPRGAAPHTVPMSFTQQRLWFLDRLAPGSPLYNLPAPFRLDGPLSVPALRAALRAVAARHEVLRTAYALSAEGEPVQVIAAAEAAALEMPLLDLAGLPEACREAELARLAAAEAAAPFDLARGPVLRARLVHLGELEHAALVTFHHIASDGWSMGVFLGELSALYAAALAGRPSPLPSLPLQYADFAVWQRQQLSGPALEAEVAFWRRLLDGAPTVLELPADRPRPSLQSPRGAAFSFALPAALSRSVRETAARERATPAMLLQAAYAALLHRLTGLPDLLVGIGVANRNRLETEGLIGFFVNTLVTRARPGGNPPFRALLDQVREVSLAIFAHQDMPFDKLVDELALPRDLSRMPLVQAAFVFQNMPAPPREMGSAILRPLPVPVTTAKFDLLLALVDSEPEIAGVAEYSTDLFDESRVAGWMAALQDLLAAFAADPGRRLHSVPLFAAEAAAALGALPGKAADIAAVFPLTPTQRDLYLDHRLDPSSTVYSLGLSLDLPPGTDPDRWERAVRAVAAREGALQVRVADLRGEPFQALLPPLHPAADPCPFEHVQGGLVELLASRIKVPYDLRRGPLARHFLLHREDGGLTAALAVHHLVCDAFSGRLFFERVAAAYASAGSAGLQPATSQDRKKSRQDAGAPSEDAPAGSPFFDWVGESLARFDTPEVEAFWRERLPRAAAFEPAGAATGDPRPRSRRHLLRGGELDRLRAFCAGRDVHPAALLRALYAALLARLFDPTGDLLLHDVVSGRPREHADTIGCFYQVVPVLLPPETFDGTVAGLLAAVRQYRRDLGERQNLSVLLQRRIDRIGRIGHTAGLRFFYNFYHFAVLDLRLDLDTDRAVLKVHDSFPPDEVHLIVSDNGDQLDVSLHFDARLFPGLHLLDRLRSALGQVLAGTERLDALDPLLPGERRQVLAEWNDTALARDPHADLARLLEEAAARTPDAMALTFEDASLTYAELHRRAGRLAGLLRCELGVGPESVVGVHLERSIEMVVSLLGIVRAGGAYLPLEPSYPADRLAFMLEDSGVAAVLAAGVTSGAMAGALPGGAATSHIRVLALDRLNLSEDEGTDPAPQRALLPAHPAYVIYTSGSTGRPKGAVNTHRAIVNRLLWMQEAHGLGPGDAVLQKTPFSFDVSVWEFFWPLLTGARLVVARPGGHQDPGYLARLIREQGITTLHFVPSLLGVFLEAPGIESCASLRRVIASGEALPAESVRRFDERLGGAGARLHNLYGPTEAAVDVSAFPLPPGFAGTAVPIGRPIANVRLHLLDRGFRPVPPGVRGELYIGDRDGSALARGYHRRPALTAERFVPDPLADLCGAPGGRLYRTGDVARLRPDGQIEYLGRTDDQVKIRGVRIELQEIEAVLRRQPAVGEAVVVARRDEPGGPRLVGYVAPAAGAALVIEELRAALGRTLPEAMVPAAFVVLPALPLSPNGKVDRKALPAPERPLSPAPAAATLPRTAFEETIAAVWRQVLQREQVGVFDNFFDLGGHSLLLAQAAAALESRLGIEIAMVELFQHPTIAALADHLAERPAGAAAGKSAEAGAARTRQARERAALRQEAAARTAPPRRPERGRPR